MNNILFICLGNICRSPLAEGFLQYHINQRKLGGSFNIDSAGTGNWHIGKPPDRRAVRVAAEYGVDISKLRARQITPKDMDSFALVIAMDRNNLSELQLLRTNANADCQIELLSESSHEPGFIDVPDPWYGDYKDFQSVARQIDSACCSLLEKLLQDG